MSKHNKAQITLIIAIALFIFIIAAFIFYIANYYKNKNPIEPLVFEKGSIENYINNCIKRIAEDGLKQLGKNEFVVDNLKIPSAENIQDKISLYINNNLNSCLKDFNDFKKQGWDIERDNINTKTQINQDDVSFEVDFPIKISDKESTISFDKFVTKVNVRLKYIYDLISKIVEFNAKYPKSIDRTALNNYDVNITMFPQENSLVYVIEDEKSLIMNKPFTVMFGLKLDEK